MGAERCVLTLPLKTERWQEDIIDKRLEICRSVYNAMLGYELKKLRTLQKNEEYATVTNTLYELAKDGEKGSPAYKAAGKRRSELIREYGFSEFAFIADVAGFSSYFAENLGSNAAAISVAKPMWRAFDTMFFGKGDMVHFKKKNAINSVATNGKSLLRVTDAEGKTIEKRENEKELFITYGATRGKHRVLRLPIRFDIKNEYETEMLSHSIKQVRIVRKKEKGIYKYYVQLCLEGKPAVKYLETGEEKHPIGSGSVGVFVTTKSVTVASEQGISKYSLSEGVHNYSDRIAELQQYMDTSRRATNPDNFNEDGTIKKGLIVNGERRPLTWTYSNRYYKAKNEVAELRRLESVQRQLHHQKLANDILAQGNSIRVNDYSFAYAAKRSNKDEVKEDGTPASKKRGGKNVGENAPAMLIMMIEQKLKNVDGEIVKVNLNELPGFKDAMLQTEYWAKHLMEI